MCRLSSLTPNLTLVPADSARSGMPAPTLPVIEIVSFRAVAGTSVAALLEAAKGTAAPLRSQPGFQRRSLIRADDGTWTDHVHWASMTEAMAAADAMMAEPAFGPFMALIDGSSVVMRHEPVLWQMD